MISGLPDRLRPALSQGSFQRRHAMETSRRKFVVQGGAAFTGLALINAPFLAQAFPSRKGEEVVPWLDQPPANPVPEVVRSQLRWEDLDSWVTPNDRFFGVGHYNWPVIDEKAWTLEVTGLVKRPTDLHVERPCRKAPARGHLHARMLRQPWLSLVHRRHRYGQMGGHAAGSDPRGSTGARPWHRSGLLRQRCGRGGSCVRSR